MMSPIRRRRWDSMVRGRSIRTRGMGSGLPRPDTANLVDTNAGQKPRGCTVRREFRVRVAQNGVELLQQRGGPALDDPRGPGNGEVGPHPLYRRIDRDDRDGDARILADVA